MPIGEFATRDVITAPRQASVLDVAKLMRKHHVGDIVVTDEIGGRNVPAGIVTDRDIVLETLAQDVDPERVSAGDIMTQELVTVKESDGVFGAIELMRATGTRRAPVVDPQGALTGIISVDDLVGLLAEELSAVSKLISREQKQEVATRR